MNLTDDQVEQLYAFARGLAERGKSDKDIERSLFQKTNDPQTISDIIKRIKKARHTIARRNGLTKMGFGSLILVVGFLITCINFHSSQSFTVVMYSTSVIGLTLIFWGLYDIMG